MGSFETKTAILENAPQGPILEISFFGRHHDGLGHEMTRLVANLPELPPPGSHSGIPRIVLSFDPEGQVCNKTIERYDEGSLWVVAIVDEQSPPIVGAEFRLLLSAADAGPLENPR